mmetsp:Transcript_5389/g.11920  ORF Transcript_5389/g.11920 Transcript_5389/m.11920 type:complete len:680 (-) Transcript_5389:15-2054(-)
MACITDTVRTPGDCEVTEPLWYIEFMLLMRLLVLGPSGSPASEPAGFKPPPRTVQFLVHLISSPATSRLLETANSLACRPSAEDTSTKAENGGESGFDDAFPYPSDEVTDKLLLAYHGAVRRHTGDILMACQYILEKLYGDSIGKNNEPQQTTNGHEIADGHSSSRTTSGLSAGAEAEKREKAQRATVSGVLMATSFHFGAELMLGRGPTGRSPYFVPRSPRADAAAVSLPHSSSSNRSLRMGGATGPDSSPRSPGLRHPMFASNTQFSSFIEQLCASAALLQNPGDRFLRCMREVLFLTLGTAPLSLTDLPEPLAPIPRQRQSPHILQTTHGETENGSADAPESGAPRSFVSGTSAWSLPQQTEAASDLDVRTFARIARTVLQAYYTDPALLAARDAVRGKCQNNSADFAATSGVPLISSGSFYGTGEWSDLVAVTDQGPLRRNLAFMEQSPLLQVVHNKLRTADFRDVVGSTDQLSAYALRNLRILWFDMRRCTSTLKKDVEAMPQQQNGGDESVRSNAKGRNPHGAYLHLGIRNLSLCLTSDWEATLATFPYLSLSGGVHVTVKGLDISFHAQLSHRDGLVFHRIHVGEPELEVQLSCSSALSQVALSIVLAILQESLQQQIQRQLQRMLGDLLRREASRWNQSWWRRITLVTPKTLICEGLTWIGQQLPPEGVPI